MQHLLYKGSPGVQLIIAIRDQYSSNDQGNVEKLIRTYLSQNSGGLTYSYDKNRDQRNGIFYREPKDGDQSKGILLTLHASAEVPTSFLAMFDVNTLHVGVYSTAKIVKSTPSNSDDVFGYAIMGTGTSDEIRLLMSGIAILFSSVRMAHILMEKFMQEKILLSMAKIMELLLKMGPNLVLHRKMIMFFGHLEIMNGILS